MTDDALFALLFGADSEGASELTWEVGSRCTCWTADTRQPQWDCPLCGGYGTAYAAPTTIRGLFRSQARWTSHWMSGEHGLGEAALTVLEPHKPGYTDQHVRDRYTVVHGIGDIARGRVFYPAAAAVPFLWLNATRAWRVQLQGLDQTTRTKPQP